MSQVGTMREGRTFADELESFGWFALHLIDFR